MRFDTSMEGLCNMGRSESFAEQLNDPEMNLSRFMNSGKDKSERKIFLYLSEFRYLVSQTATQRTRHSFGGKTENADPLAGLPTKQFGLGKLILRFI